LRGAPLLTKPLRRNDLLDAARRLVPSAAGGSTVPDAVAEDPRS